MLRAIGPRSVASAIARALTLAILGALAAVPLIVIWNVLGEVAGLHWKISLGRALSGVTEEVPVARPNLASLLDGRFQRTIAARTGSLVPYRNFLIRLNNEVVFTMLGGTPNKVVFRGKGNELYPRSWIEEYCQRSLVRFVPQAHQRIKQLKEIQQYFLTRGVIFLYVITPSKAVQMPDAWQPLYQCASSAEERNSTLPIYVQLLRESGIQFVDVAAVIANAGQHSEQPMFPKGGVHWNSLGAAYGAQAIIQELNQVAGSLLLPELDWSYTISNEVTGSDRDFVDLLNLLLSRWTDHVPVTTIWAKSSCTRDRLEVTIVGGSFMTAIPEVLFKTGCISRVRFFFYLYSSLFEWMPFHLIKDNLNATDMTSLKEADIFVLEENESLIAQSNYVPELHRILTGSETQREGRGQ